jgi:hypothetical protein
MVVAVLAALAGAFVASDEWGTKSGAAGGSSSTDTQENALSAGGSAQPDSSAVEAPAQPAPAPSRALPAARTGARPTIRSLSPLSGDEAGGNEVTIEGANFSRVQVLFNSSVARVVSETSDAVTVVAPKQADAPVVSVVVTNRDGSYAVASGAYRYTR